MAFQMAYSSADGVDHQASYWRPNIINLAVHQKVASINFIGYKDEAARIAGKNPVGSKSYTVKGTDYDTYFSSAVLDQYNPIASSYAFATNTLDTNGVSFFNGAESV